MGYEIDFLPADKHKNFLQIDRITLGGHAEACPKHPKQQPCIIFTISQEKHEGWSWIFSADNCQTFFQSDTIILDVCSQTCPNYPKQKLCYFSAIS